VSSIITLSVSEYRALSRTLFRVSIMHCLHVAVVRSHVRAAHLAHALSCAVRTHHLASIAPGQTWSRALPVCSFARDAHAIPMFGARRRVACFS
jgi:hypothetical protein